MNKTDLIKALQEGLWSRIAPTQHGVGVVALRAIPRGTNVFEGCDCAEWVEIDERELPLNLPQGVWTYIKDFMCHIGTVYYFPNVHPASLSQAWFLNHSSTPNMGTTDGGETFRALRDIKEGEELTVDYTTYCDTSDDPFVEN